MALVFWISACEQSNLDEPSPKDDLNSLKSGGTSLYSGITVSNGRVKFANSSSFDAYHQQSGNYTEKQTEDFFAGLSFNSLKAKKQAAELLTSSPQPGDPAPSPEEEGSEGEDNLVEDEFIYFLLNEQGEFQIESAVIRITPEFTYVYDENENITFDAALETVTQQAYLNATNPDDFFDVNSKVQAFKIQNNGQKRIGIYCGQSASDYHIYMNRRKMKAEIWSRNLGIFASGGFSTKNLRKRWGIWWQERTDFVSVGWRNVVFELKDPYNGNTVTITYPDGDLPGTNVSKRIRRFQLHTAIVGKVCDPITGKCKPSIKPAGCIKIKSARTSHVARHGSHQGMRSLSL
jgi:hypothetical protein